MKRLRKTFQFSRGLLIFFYSVYSCDTATWVPTQQAIVLGIMKWATNDQLDGIDNVRSFYPCVSFGVRATESFIVLGVLVWYWHCCRLFNRASQCLPAIVWYIALCVGVACDRTIRSRNLRKRGDLDAKLAHGNKLHSKTFSLKMAVSCFSYFFYLVATVIVVTRQW